MLVLGLDTATRRVGVVLANEHGMLGRVELGGTADTAPPRHAETLAPAIAWCCARGGVELTQVSAVAVGIGPGMFTGLRVGVTTAKVLAQSLRIPVIPIPSLDLLAYPLRYARRLVVATIDARRHIELFGDLLEDAAEPMPIREHVAFVLGGINSPEANAELVKSLAVAPARLQNAIANGLAASFPGAEKLLDAVAAEASRIAASAPKQLRKFSYVDRGRYAEQLERAFRLFPREQFLVIKYEEFRVRQRETVEAVFRFLNLSPARFRAVEAHDIPYVRKIRDEERAAVREILRSDIGRLEALLGWDCCDWR